MTQRKRHEPIVPSFHDKGDELPFHQWGQLEEGHNVIVQRDGGTLLTGVVDDRTHDASVFWVWLDGGRGRVAIYAQEGTTVWVPSGKPESATGEPG
ncbi:hypothetical protein Q9R30_14200 [Arthrobacter sp. AB6]|uniref:hypothetical protein n=1 Tax=Arthrobacter sp. AB6 TaxID=2962570 RepID=UPI002881DFF3|nr:hypothetical protein [Arthrobacter sp. AB6]MDT0196511.1 hypothetical protein [Arthrobacter sp. AB6]